MSERADFDVPADVAYFNTANLAPQLRAVRAAGEAALERRARPWTISAADWFSDAERLRTLFGALVGADAEGVALVPATSYGFAVAARNLALGPGDRVVVLAEEYPSGIYAWRAAGKRTGAEIVTVVREAGQTWTDALLAVVDEHVAVVSVPNVHWTDGALVDLGAVAARTRDVGARLVIDGSQSIGAMPLDVGELRPDFVVSVGYKWLLGPFSVGYLYVAEEHRQGEPLEENWILRAGSEDFARLVDYRDEYQPGARRFDAGARTKFELTPMAIAALEQLLEWEIPHVAATLAAVTGDIARRARELELDPLPDDQRGPHMLGVRLPDDVRKRILPALAEAGCYAALRGSSLRIAPHLHTTGEDVERLLAALAGAVHGERARERRRADRRDRPGADPSLPRAAATVIRDCLNVRPGEDVLVVCDSSTSELAHALRDAAEAAGAEAALMLTRQRRAQDHGTEPPTPVAAALAATDVFIAATTASLSHTEARAAATCRGARGATMPGATADIVARLMGGDIPLMTRRSRAVAQLLSAAGQARLTCPRGTDLALDLTGREGIADDGKLTERGSWGNLPAGEGFISPTSGDGRIVASALAGLGLPTTPLRLEISDGRLVDCDERFLDLLDKHGAAGRNLAELGIGTNENARLTGNVLEDEKMLGSAHIAFGASAGIGGTVAVPVHLDCVVVGATLTLDDVTVLDHGSFVLQA